MAKIPEHPLVKTRTERAPVASDRRYVVIEGAPKHYIGGYGIVGPGDIVTLGDDVKPGKYLLEVHQKDANKAAASEEDAAKLAALAAEKAAEEKAAADAKAEADRVAAEKAAAKK